MDRWGRDMERRKRGDRREEGKGARQGVGGRGRKGGNWTSSLQTCEIIDFSCSKPPNVWHSVTKALGNEDTRFQDEG